MGRDTSKKSVTSVPTSRTQTSAHGYARSVNRTKHGASCVLKHGAVFMRWCTQCGLGVRLVTEMLSMKSYISDLASGGSLDSIHTLHLLFVLLPTCSLAWNILNAPCPEPKCRTFLVLQGIKQLSFRGKAWKGTLQRYKWKFTYTRTQNSHCVFAYFVCCLQRLGTQGSNTPGSAPSSIA